MKVVINYRDKFIRRELVRLIGEQYPNSITESYDDPLMAARSVYVDPADVMIVGLEGVKLIPMLKKRNADIRVVIIAENDSHRDRAYSMGADAYMSIPIKSDILYASIDGTLSVDVL